jgi:hypothetical protein
LHDVYTKLNATGLEREFWYYLRKVRRADRDLERNYWKLGRIDSILRSRINESSMRELHSELQIIDYWELEAFHAVALLYERIATFLVCGEALLPVRDLISMNND